ncbi:MAG: efflux transporter outer membrane subunit [Phycisphaeraceae bacterium]|nr:efflux transporter outer membrane subunit [Phycisphaeraceae bacterium]
MTHPSPIRARPMLVLPVAMLSALAGCNVGPDYAPPKIDAPSAWAEPSGAPGLQADLSRWWTSLNDPVLDGLVARAIAGNFDLRYAEQRVAEARALRRGAEAGGLPTLDANATYQRQRPSSDLVNLPAGTRNRAGDSYAVGFDASWELDVWGAVRRAVESADATIASAEDFRRDVMVALTSEVARNYIDLRAFQQRIAIARQNIAAQEETLKLTEARFKAGITSELDVSRAKSNLETTRSVVPSLQTGARFAQHRIAVLLGRFPAELIAELDAPAPIPAATSAVPAGLPSDLLRRRPDIRGAERDLAAQNALIGVAVADLYPRFSLNGSIGLQAGQIGNLFDATSRAYSAGPAITWRIFDGGRIRANIQVQETRTRQLLEIYQGVVVRAVEDVENALVAHAREQVRRAALALAVDAAKRSVELSESLYSKGLTDFQNVLDAQRSLFNLQDQLVESEGVLSANLVAIYKALGGGWSDEPAGAAPSAEPQAVPPAGAPAKG